MSAPQRFWNGVTNVSPDKAMSNLLVPFPFTLHQWQTDFDVYNVNDWLITNTGAGTQVVADADGGVLTLTNAAANDDNTWMQWIGGTGVAVVETFLPAYGKKMWFMARFKISDADNCDMIMGLQIKNTSPLDSASATDGIFFKVDDGDGYLDFHHYKGSAASSLTAVATLADDTYVTTAFYYDGIDKITTFVNDVESASVTVNSTAITTAELAVMFGIQNGEAVAKIMDVDYIYVAKER